MEASMQGIFTACFAGYAQAHALSLNAYKGAQAIMQCRTSALGGHVQRCPAGHVAQVHYNACRHRSCPRCAALPKARWADAQQQRLLACDHYHVVFTLPHELLPVWRYNTRWFADALFQSCRDTLMTLLGDPRHLGAEPGIVMALHTWGRSLSLHPHIHCLVSGGGLTPSGRWRAVDHQYLLPVRVVKALYKGKLLGRLWAAINDGVLTLPPDTDTTAVRGLLKAVNRKDWNVRLQTRYAHGHGVMRYLSRYVKGGPISDHRIVSASPAGVRFRYKDHREGRTKWLRLTPYHFMTRVLWHVPEAGQHTIRHYGVYAHRAKAKRQVCREQLMQAPEPDALVPLTWRALLQRRGLAQRLLCPHCARDLEVGMHFGRRRVINSIAQWPRTRFVQQAVEVRHDTVAVGATGPPE